MASDLGLHCLPMSHKKDARLIMVKENIRLNYAVYFEMLNAAAVCTIPNKFIELVYFLVLIKI